MNYGCSLRPRFKNPVFYAVGGYVVPRRYKINVRSKPESNYPADVQLAVADGHRPMPEFQQRTSNVPATSSNVPAAKPAATSNQLEGLVSETLCSMRSGLTSPS